MSHWYSIHVSPTNPNKPNINPNSHNHAAHEIPVLCAVGSGLDLVGTGGGGAAEYASMGGTVETDD